jgi:hypothetical protein
MYELKNKIILLFLFYVICCGIGASAQTVISGTVRDKTGESLTGANIYLEGTYDGISSDEDGNFKLITSQEGKHILKINFIGFEGVSIDVILNGAPLNFDVQLKKKFNQMNAVTITAGSFEAGDQKKSVVMSSIDMVTTAGAKGDVYGALQTLPGTITNGESGKLFVKGGNSDESQTYIDGTLVHAPYNSTPPQTATRGRFNPFMFKGTIFSTGGYSAEYGQALSSVLQLNTNDMPLEDELNISILTIGAELAGTKLWNTGAVTATLSYTNLKPYMSVAPQNLNWHHPPESIEAAISVRQKTGKTGMVKMYATINRSYLSLDRLNLNEKSEKLAYDLKNNNLFVNASWRTTIGKKWSYKTGLSVTENQDEIAYGGINVNESLKGGHFKNVFSYYANDKLTIRIGHDFFMKDYTLDFSQDTLNMLGSFRANTLSIFTEIEVYVTSKFVARLGGRYEYSDYLKTSTVSPRLSTAYKFTDYSQFSIAYGWFYQDPPNDLLIYSDNIRQERADHLLLSFQSSKNRRTFRSEIYYKNYKNLVKYSPLAPFDYNAYSNTGQGYAYGFDIFWRDNKTIRAGEYWVSYGYLDSERDYRDYPYQVIPNYVSKHNLSVVYKHYITPIRSLVGGSFKLASPRLYTNPNIPGFNNQETISYKSFDLNWTYLHRENIIFYAGITNVLGFKQEFGYRYADVPNVDGVYESEAIVPGSNRFFVVACFITLSKKGDLNQLDEIQ